MATASLIHLCPGFPLQVRFMPGASFLYFLSPFHFHRYSLQRVGFLESLSDAIKTSPSVISFGYCISIKRYYLRLSIATNLHSVRPAKLIRSLNSPLFVGCHSQPPKTVRQRLSPSVKCRCTKLTIINNQDIFIFKHT